MEEEMEMLHEVEEQESFLEIVFIRKAREATAIKFHQPKIA